MSAVYNPSTTYANTKYNGKELQETGAYDYGWRQYMPDIGRWNVMDQLSETYHSYSPYAYVMNNPIMMYDPDGREAAFSVLDMWHDARPGGVTTYSDFGSGGGPGSVTFSPMSSSEYNSFYNFLAGGGTGSYTYWTGDAMPSSTYSNIGGINHENIQGIVGHTVNIKGNENGSNDYWNSLNAVDNYHEMTEFGIGSTLGIADTYSNRLIKNGKMIKANTFFKKYNLYRTNGALNGNQYISATKFLNRARVISTISNHKAVKAVGFLGVGISVAQFKESHHPGYITRGAVGFLLGRIPYAGAAMAFGIEQTDIDYWNAWTLVAKVQGDNHYNYLHP